MSIQLSEYVDADEVRAILGLSEYELSDDAIAQPVFVRALQRRLRSIAGDFGTSTGLALDEYHDDLTAELTLTEPEEDFLNVIHEFAVYVVAESLLSGLPLTAVKSMTDSKNFATRFSPSSTFTDVTTGVELGLKQALTAIYKHLGVTATEPAAVAAMVPATDRITG
jgi:hypothetical protein